MQAGSEIQEKREAGTGSYGKPQGTRRKAGDGMKDGRVKISVIVTIHNAENYLQECLESVLAQTFPEIEVLCMDGGSTDSTPEILQSYARRDGRIRVIMDPNTSYGHKVNRGIAEAGGEYLSVLESDDMYEPFMLEKLYQAAEQHHADFVNGDYTNFFDMAGRRFGYVTKMYRGGDYGCLINYKEQPERFGVIPRYWTGLFRKDFLLREEIRMNESPGASYQDMSFRFLTSILAQRAYHIEIPLYLYRVDNPGSSMYDSKKTVVIADEHDFLQKELLRRNITDCFVWHNAYQWKYMDFRGNMRHLKGRYRQELFERYLAELDKDRKELEHYRYLGYSEFVSGMIDEEPQKVQELLLQDEAAEREERARLYRLPERISKLEEKQKIIIFGCGKMGRAVLEQMRFLKERICCLSDNAEALWNTRLSGCEVLPPEAAAKRHPDAFYIIANKQHGQDMARQLREMGVPEGRIWVY